MNLRTCEWAINLIKLNEMKIGDLNRCGFAGHYEVICCKENDIPAPPNKVQVPLPEVIPGSMTL